MFVRGVRLGCDRIVGDFQSLTSWRCDCPGFAPIAAGIGAASFAQPNDEPDEIQALRRA